MHMNMLALNETDPREIKKELLSCIGRLTTIEITERRFIIKSNEYVVKTDVEYEIEEVLDRAIEEAERREGK